MPRLNRTDKLLTALQASFVNDEGEPVFETLDDMAAFAIDRYAASYFDAELPEGWVLNDDLTLTDIEKYYEAYNDEGNSREWGGRGRTIRAAASAGWIVSPAGFTVEDAGKLKPRAAALLKNALDAHYLKLMIADPKSSGPSPTT